MLRGLTSNYIINVGVVAFFSAQVLKLLFTLVLTRKLVWERMLGAGGMPSSHAALTSSISVAMVSEVGFNSPVFGLTLAFMAVVLYDAMGVRRAAGEQAKVLNRIVFELFPFLPKAAAEEALPDDEPAEDTQEQAPLLSKELKEFLGHTPLEVLGGCLVGILVAVFMPVV
jgi:acid phosphatase family membrane protein YuiD